MRRDPFAPFAGWNDTDWIKAEVEKAFAKGAGVKVPTLRRALQRVVADGWHGPFSDRDWENVSGYRMTMKRALDILARAQAATLPDVRLDHPDSGASCDGAPDCRHPDHEEIGEDGPLFHAEPVEIDREELVAWYFGALQPIYGSVWI